MPVTAAVETAKAATTLCVWPFRFHFRAVDSVHFPDEKATNILRGAFGTLFRRLACVPECQSVKTCTLSATCPYARIFEPKQELLAADGGPSGLADWPRPFVFRALHLNGLTITPGQDFYFDLILFEPPEDALPYFVLAFRELVRTGLGPGRGRATLTLVHDLSQAKSGDSHEACPNGTLSDSEGTAPFADRAPAEATVLRSSPSNHSPLPGLLYADHHFTTLSPQPLRFNFAPSSAEPIHRITIEFLTPTELKSQGALIEQPEFAALFARLRDRLSNLRACYQGGSLDIDFRALGDAARQIRLVCSDLRTITAARQSSRTGQRHSIGGFVGTVEYEGELHPFIPFLQAAQWIGIGRQTVWGKGQLRAHPERVNA